MPRQWGVVLADRGQARMKRNGAGVRERQQGFKTSGTHVDVQHRIQYFAEIRTVAVRDGIGFPGSDLLLEAFVIVVCEGRTGEAGETMSERRTEVRTVESRQTYDKLHNSLPTHPRAQMSADASSLISSNLGTHNSGAM